MSIAWLCISCATATPRIAPAPVPPKPAAASIAEAPLGSLELRPSALSALVEPPAVYPWDEEEKRKAKYLAEHPAAHALIAGSRAWQPMPTGLAVAEIVEPIVRLRVYSHDATTPRTTRELPLALRPYRVDADTPLIVFIDVSPSGALLNIRVDESYAAVLSTHDLATRLYFEDAETEVLYVADERAIWTIDGCVCEGTSSRVHRVFVGDAAHGFSLRYAMAEAHLVMLSAGYALEWSERGVFWTYGERAVTTWDLEGRSWAIRHHDIIEKTGAGFNDTFVQDDYGEMKWWPALLRVEGPERVSVLEWREGILRWIVLTPSAAHEAGRVALQDVEKLAWSDDGGARVQTKTGVLEIVAPAH